MHCSKPGKTRSEMAHAHSSTGRYTRREIYVPLNSSTCEKKSHNVIRPQLHRKKPGAKQMKRTLKTTYLQDIRTKTGMLAAQHNLRPIERATIASHTSQARSRAMSAIAGSAWHGRTLPVVGKLNHVAESKAIINFGVRKKRNGQGREGEEGLPTVEKTGKLRIECAGCAFTGKYSARQWLRQCPVRPVPSFLRSGRCVLSRDKQGQGGRSGAAAACTIRRAKL